MHYSFGILGVRRLWINCREGQEMEPSGSLMQLQLAIAITAESAAIFSRRI